MMEVYDVRHVFTPATPAVLTFIDREPIVDPLFDALNTPGMQIVVYGHSGSGKTTLLRNMLNQTYESHLTTSCMAGLTFNSLILDAFDQLAPFYVDEKSHTGKSAISSSVKANYVGIKGQIGAQMSNESTTTRRRMLPPQLTPQGLARFIGEAGTCWVVEDFHKMAESEKHLLAETMKIFMDEAGNYTHLKIIAVGAVGTAREVVAYDSNMRSRVAEIPVPLMTREEIGSIIDKGEQLLNVRFPVQGRQTIERYSNGLAAVCHQLALNTCFVSGVNETSATKKTFETGAFQKALEMYVGNESDSTKAVFDKALRQKRRQKFDNCRLVIGAIATNGMEDGISRGEILAVINKTTPNYPPGNLNLYLKELQTEDRGELIKFDPNSGKYSFTNPFHMVMARFLTEQVTEETVDFGAATIFSWWDVLGKAATTSQATERIKAFAAIAKLISS